MRNKSTTTTDIKKASEEFLSHGGKITKVATGDRALTSGGKKKKKANAKVRHHEDGPAGGDTADPVDPEPDIVPDRGVDTGISERPFAAAESYDDDQPHRKGHHGHAQHDIAIGKGKKPMVMTTAVVDHSTASTADNDEPDELLPGYWKRHPEAKERRDQKTRRRQKRNAKLDSVMSQVKVGADPVGIRTQIRNMQVAEFRGKGHFARQTLENLGIPLAHPAPPTRGYKRPTGRGVHTPKGTTDFGVEKIVRRIPRDEMAKRIALQKAAKEIRALRNSKKPDGAKIGRVLIRAKKALLHRGKFLAWVQELGLTARTAQRYEAMAL